MNHNCSTATILHPEMMIHTVKMLAFYACHVSSAHYHILFVTAYIFITDSCQDGDVRLVGGQSAYVGRVEVCLSQRWAVADPGVVRWVRTNHPSSS